MKRNDVGLCCSNICDVINDFYVKTFSDTNGKREEVKDSPNKISKLCEFLSKQDDSLTYQKGHLNKT